MKLIAISSFFICFSFTLFSQTQGVAYPTVGKGVATTFVTDYHCLGINNSALGWGTGYEKYKITTGAFESNGGIYSDALTSDKLKSFAKAIYHQMKQDSNTKNINWKLQQEAAAEYAEKGLLIDGQYNWGGFSYQTKRFGGIAFNVSESYNWYSKLNSNLTDMIFRGKIASIFDSLTIVVGTDTSMVKNDPNMSQDSLDQVISGSISVPLNLSDITKGSSMRMVWNRSYNFGYGRKILGKDSVFVLYGGLGGRFIQSMAMFSFESGDNGIELLSSLTPAFNINYGSIASTNPSSFLNYKGGIPPAVGNGYGVDVSASVILFNKFKFAIAVNNMGHVNYTRNVYSVKDTLVTSISLSGLSNENLIKGIEQMVTSGGILTLVGEQKFKVRNPSTIRFGGSFHPFDRFCIGFEVVAPFDRRNPGSIQSTIVSVGAGVKIFKWMELSAGYYGGGIYLTNIPLGVNFILKEGKYELGIASRDMLSFFTTNSHTFSGAMGIARLRF